MGNRTDLFLSLGLEFLAFRGLDWRALLYRVSGVHFIQLILVKPAGGGELNVYHEEDWMPGKNALIGSLKKQAGLSRSKVIGFLDRSIPTASDSGRDGRRVCR
jgi:hypothetical protein